MYLDPNADGQVALSDLLEVVTDLRNGIGLPTPQVVVSLAHDTAPRGATNGDQHTFDPAMAGQVLEGLTGGSRIVGRMDSGAFFRVAVDAQGQFQFDTDLARDGSDDGQHTLRLNVQNFGGPISTFDLTFTLDTVGPQPPTLELATESDSGRSDTDGVTNIATPTFRVTAQSGDIVRLLSDGVEVASGIAHGPVALATSPLAEGRRQIHAVVEDLAGNGSTFGATIAVTIDTTLPAPTLELSAGSRASLDEGRTTGAGRVTLSGRTEPGAVVKLLETGVESLVTGVGTFQFPDVGLAVGANSFSIQAWDLAGNSRQITQVISRLEGAGEPEAVLTWTQVALEAIRTEALTPLAASRALVMLSAAIYDTLNALEGAPAFLAAKTAAAGASLDAAVAAAAHEALSYLFPAQQTDFDAELQQTLDNVPDGPGEDSGVTLGQAIASDIILLRSVDGWDRFVDYNSRLQPGQWQPTGPMFDVALSPQWATLAPFAMTSPDQFRPTGPPALNSPEYAAALNEVKELGRADSAARTAEQTEIARFWSDGLGTYTPPGHWNQIAIEIAQELGLSRSASARLLAQLNMALADASIAAWDAKYAYELWRPVTAIRGAAADGNDATAADPTWKSLIINPPFPEYVSGHSTYSGAAAEILTAILGDNISFTTSSLGLPGVERTFANFEQAAQEAGRSRIYGGIHFQFASQDGLNLGRQIAELVLERFQVSADQQAPVVIVTSPAAGQTVKEAFVVEGRALDNLSGVASLTATLDGGASFNVSLDATGRFSIPVNLPLDGSANGAHTLSLSAADVQGNMADPVTFGFTLDTLPPVITIDSIADGAELTQGATLTGTADATGSSIVKLAYRLNDGAVMPISFNSSGGGFIHPLDLSKLAAGAHTLTVTAMDAAGLTTTITLDVNLPEPIPLSLAGVTPLSGSSAVGLTVRPQVFFSRPVNPATLNANNLYATDTTGAKLPATIIPAQDNSFAWLFFADPMPGASIISVHVEGDTILAASDVQPLDADGDGVPGGEFTFQFSTVSLASIPNTTIAGVVVDTGPDLMPMTTDDVLAGADQSLGTSDDVYRLPLAGVQVFVFGREDQAVTTDAQGRFTLTGVPTGDVKLVVNGLTATNAPQGWYFPELTMDMTVEPGRENLVMEGMAKHLGGGEGVRGVYLPRLRSSVLEPVSDTETTVIGVYADSAAELTPEQRQFLTIEVAANSVVDFDGNPIANPQVGLATVPREYAFDMLPAGLLEKSFVFTVQSPAAGAFTAPAPMTLPNIYNAPPGAKLFLMSADHATGQLVNEGPATVSADGRFLTTDPGIGVTHPGWHILSPPGSCIEEPSQQVIQDVAAASIALGYTIDAVGDINSAVEGLNEVLGASLPRLPSSVGHLFTGIGIAQDLFTAFNLDGESDFWDRTEAVSSLLLQGALLFSPGGWIVTAGKFALVARDLYSAYESMEEASKRIEKLRTQAKCPAPTTRESPTPFSLSIARQATMAAEIAGAQQPLLDQIGSTLTQMGDILSQGVGDQPLFGLNDEQVQQFQALADQFNSLLSQIDALGVFWSITEDIRVQLENWIEAHGGSPRGGVGNGGGGIRTSPPASCPAYWIAEFGGTVLRGRGNINFLGPPNSTFRIRSYDPTENEIAEITFQTGASATPVLLQNLVWQSVQGLADDDHDGLVNDAESIVGTLANNRDSDGDGVSDFAEVRQCLDPLSGRSVTTGVIASLPLRGEAKEIVVLESISDSQQQTAYLATGSYGLAIINASQFSAPTVLAQLDLSGDATDVAVDTWLGMAAVASNTGGLHLVDVSNSANPRLLHTVNVNARQVEVFEGVVYVTVGAELRSYDLLTGDRLETVPFLGSNITGMAREGLMLYTRDSSQTLRVVDLSSGAMVARGSATIPVAGSKVFVGGGVAYAGGDGANQGKGFATIDVSDPDSPAVISGPDSTQVTGRSIVLNGSGLAINVGPAGTQFGTFGPPVVDILNISNPANTGAFVTQFPLQPNGSNPSNFVSALSVAIGAGIAFIADGPGGLTVVNYLPFDNLGQAPTVNVNAADIDHDPNTPGVQAPEGTTIQVAPAIADDVQVRNVELLLNGQVVRSDVSFPFEFSTVVPALSAGADTMTVQVRATDTGGNTALSDPLVIDILPDVLRPSVVSVNPADGVVRGRNFRAIRIAFSEPVDEATVTSENIQLRESNGAALAPFNIQLRNGGRLIQLTYDALPLGENRIIVAAAVTDRAGNSLGADFVSTFQIRDYDAVWINPAGGFWDDANSWDSGDVPQPGAKILIDVPGEVIVTHRQGTTNINSLESKESLVLSGSVLDVAGTLTIHGNVTLDTATLAHATVVAGAAGAQLTATNNSNNILDGVTLNADLLLAQNNAHVRIRNGLTLNGVVRMINHSSLSFEGTQTLSGAGTVEFPTNGSLGVLEAVTNGTALTIGPDMMLRGGRGQVGGHLRWGRTMSVVNQGTIIAQTAGQTVLFQGVGTGSTVQNQGMLQASGGVLEVHNLIGAVGAVSIGNGGRLDLEGTFTNDQDRTLNDATLSLEGTWTNLATIAVGVNGTLNLGGTFTQETLGTAISNGGAVNLTGTLDNRNQTLALNATTGDWTLAGGTILGGTITTAAGAKLIATTNVDNALDGVTLNADLLLAQNNAHVRIRNGLTLNGVVRMTNLSSLSFEGTQTIGGAGTVEFPTNGSLGVLEAVTNGTTLTIGPDITLRGGRGQVGGLRRWGRTMSVVNQGTIIAQTAGQTLLFQGVGAGSTVQNQGMLQASGGVLEVSNLNSNSGAIIAGAGGLISVNGALNLEATSVLHVDLGGTRLAEHGRIAVSGAATIAGAFQVALVSGFHPDVGDEIEVLTYGSRSGDFDQVDGTDLGDGKTLLLDFRATSLVIAIAAALGAGKTIAWEYDATDNATAKIDREGRRIVYAYNDLDRLTNETRETSSAGPANVIHLMHGNRSNLLTIEDQFTEFNYTYDALGQVLTVTEMIESQAGGVTVSVYAPLRRVTSMTRTGVNVSQKRVDFTYDAEGLLQSLERHADLVVTQLVVENIYGFDDLNRLISLTHRNSTEDVAFYQLTFDAASRITQIVDIDGARDFAYDDTNQLVSATHINNSYSDEGFTYNANGNSVAAALTTKPGNRLLADATYDADGNLLRSTHRANQTVRDFTWDHRDRLTCIVDQDATNAETREVRFTYDTLNRRIAKAVDTTPADAVDAAIAHFVYDREDVLLDFLESDGSGPSDPVPRIRYLHPAYDQIDAQDDFLEQDSSLRV
jgi:YD repeat-containing protein